MTTLERLREQLAPYIGDDYDETDEVYLFVDDARALLALVEASVDSQRLYNEWIAAERTERERLHEMFEAGVFLRNDLRLAWKKKCAELDAALAALTANEERAR